MFGRLTKVAGWRVQDFRLSKHAWILLSVVVPVTEMTRLSFQHQQQVAQAVERAKQVTMAELNAIIGVRGLPGLPPTVCITTFPFLLLW